MVLVCHMRTWTKYPVVPSFQRNRRIEGVDETWLREQQALLGHWISERENVLCPGFLIGKAWKSIVGPRVFLIKFAGKIDACIRFIVTCLLHVCL